MKNDDLLCNIFTKLNRFISCCLKPYAEQSLEYFSDSEFLTPWLDESFVFQFRKKKNGEIWQGRLQWKGKKFIIFLINTALGTYLLFGWFYSNQCYYCPVTFFPVDPKIWQNFECQHYFLFTKTNIRIPHAHVVTCALVLGCRCTYKWYDFPLPNPTHQSHCAVFCECDPWLWILLCPCRDPWGWEPCIREACDVGMYVNVITNMTRFIANFRIHQIRRRLIREIRSEGAQEPGGRLDDSHSAKVRHERHVTR